MPFCDGGFYALVRGLLAVWRSRALVAITFTATSLCLGGLSVGQAGWLRSAAKSVGWVRPAGHADSG